MSDLHGRQRLTLTVEEAAELFGISRTCAYECIHRGESPARRFGRRIVIVRPELERLLGLPLHPDPDTSR
jgi:excisionase family DNA binding protein